MLTKLYVRMQTALASEEGATAVEYGIMVALIAVVIIIAVRALGVNLSGTFDDAAAAMP